jgi:hypothetical protein
MPVHEEATVCESCYKKSEDLDYCTDPFLEEIHGDTTRFWLCYRCWEDSAHDI